LQQKTGFVYIIFDVFTYRHTAMFAVAISGFATLPTELVEGATHPTSAVQVYSFMKTLMSFLRVFRYGLARMQ